MFRLARFLRGYKKQLILGPVFKLTEAIFELIVPLVMASIIDDGVKNGDAAYIWRMGAVLIALGVIGLCCALICQYYASVASQGVGTALRSALFRQIEAFSHAEMDRFGTHTLVTRLTNDTNQLQFAVAMLIRLVIRAPFLAAGAIVMSIFIDFKVTLIIIAVTPCIVFVLYFIMSRSVPFFKRIQGCLDHISLITRENLTGARVIRAFATRQRETKRFTEASEALADTAVGAGKLSALLNPLTYVIMNLGIVAVIWYGGFRVDGGALTQGELIAVVNYMTQILLALVVVANLVVTFTKASACAVRVNEIFDTTPSVTEPETDTAVESASAPAVRFCDVTFSYGGEPALQNVTFELPRGSTLGVIGGTGSGKSTIVQLILRYYDVGSGAVYVNGADVRQYSFEHLRSKIGLVPQYASVVSGTVAQNIRWGSRDGTLCDDEIWRCLRIAQAEEFVRNMPDGIDTWIEQGGKNLSGGQKQRLTIARALAVNPEIFILDDSASALDAATDLKLRTAIKEECFGMTVIMVSQRAGAIKNADQILVLDDGMIAGAGTHSELLESCAIYREILTSQGE